MTSFNAQRPSPRLETLSDLIFGLALSIGALTLIGNRTAQDASGLIVGLSTFGFGFLVLIIVWVRYSEVMSVLPVDTVIAQRLNISLLFLVAIEPYLFNVFWQNLGNTCPSGCFPDFISSAFAVDLGAINAILALFTNVLTSEEKNLVPPILQDKFRVDRNLELTAAAIFLISALPPFWLLRVSMNPVRYFLWLVPFFTRRIIWFGRRVRQPS